MPRGFALYARRKRDRTARRGWLWGADEIQPGPASFTENPLARRGGGRSLHAGAPAVGGGGAAPDHRHGTRAQTAVQRQWPGVSGELSPAAQTLFRVSNG